MWQRWYERRTIWRVSFGASWFRVVGGVTVRRMRGWWWAFICRMTYGCDITYLSGIDFEVMIASLTTVHGTLEIRHGPRVLWHLLRDVRVARCFHFLPRASSSRSLTWVHLSTVPQVRYIILILVQCIRRPSIGLPIEKLSDLLAIPFHAERKEVYAWGRHTGTLHDPLPVGKPRQQCTSLSLRHLQHYHLDGAQLGPPGISLCRFVPDSVTNTSRSRRNVCKAIAYPRPSQPFHDTAVCFEIFLQFTKKETRAPLVGGLTYEHNQALVTQVLGVRKITHCAIGTARGSEVL